MSYVSIRRFVCLSGMFLVPFATAHADDALTIPFCRAANDVDQEESETVRLERDAIRISNACDGTIAPAEWKSELVLLFKQDAPDADREQAAARLKELAKQSQSAAVHRMIQRRVEMVEAVIQGLSHVKGNSDATSRANDIAFRAAIDFESGGREVHGRIVHDSMKWLRENAPSVFATIEPVLRRHFLNYNVYITISEPMASYIVRRVNNRSEGVRQCVLGACVTGSQSTHLETRADILPSSSSGRWKVIGDGTTHTDTRAHKHPATICSIGDHCFTIDRTMDFMGGGVAFSPASIFVNANNRNVGVATTFDRVPILRGLVRKIAMRQANSKLPQSEAIAARQIKEAAIPEFEDQTGTPFMNLNGVLSRFADAREQHLNRRPMYAANSTDRHLFFRSDTRSDVNLAGSQPPAYPLPDETLVIQIHESTVNAIIDLAGAFGEAEANDFLTNLTAQKLRERGPWGIISDLRERLSGPRLAEKLKRKMPAIHPELAELIADILPSAAVFGLGTGLHVSVGDQIKDEGKRKIILEVVAQLIAGKIPRVAFKDCDPLRVRFDEGELHLVKKCGPRRNKEQNPANVETCETCEGSAVFRITNILGKLGLQRIDRTATSHIGQQIRTSFQNFVDRLKEDLDLKEKIKQWLREQYPERLANLPENVKLQAVNVEVTDGWITLELAPRRETVVAPGTLSNVEYPTDFYQQPSPRVFLAE